MTIGFKLYSRNETVTVAYFISSSIRYINGIQLSTFGFFIDRTSSNTLIWNFLSLITFYIDYSIGVKEKSTRPGAQFVPMGMLMIACKMCLPNLTIYSWLYFPIFFAYFHDWQISYFLTQYYINSLRYSLPCLNNSDIRRRNMHVFFVIESLLYDENLVIWELTSMSVNTVHVIHSYDEHVQN